MRRACYIIFVLPVLILACSKHLNIQDQVLTILEGEIRIGGSLQAALQEFPSHRAAGNGMYLFQMAGPNAVQRILRVRAEGDTILWLQIQDEPVAANLAEEYANFELEELRLSQILGSPKRRGSRMSKTRTADWENVQGLKFQYRLDISRDPVFSRRTLTLEKIARK